MTTTTMSSNGQALAVLVGFGRALREEGIPVALDQVVTYCTALGLLDVTQRHDLYWAGRSCLISGPAHVPIYDQVFDRYFGDLTGMLRLTVQGVVPRSEETATPDAARWMREALRGPEEGDGGMMASGLEALRRKRFSDCTPEELAQLAKLIRELRLLPRARRVRRTKPDPRGPYPDVRHTVRRSLRTQGELLAQARRARRTRPRTLALVLDVSGSMAGYSRALLQFAYSTAAVASGTTEVFCFGTRLTRITDAVRRRDPDEALAEAAEAVVDWEGGTRIGDCLGELVRTWARPGPGRGAIVIICSDGLEQGDPMILAAEMARLARLAHRIVWVNPLKGDPGYQPLARGMSAALPHVDAFVSGRDLASLEALAGLLPTLA